jgi:hypothetical protein
VDDANTAEVLPARYRGHVDDAGTVRIGYAEREAAVAALGEHLAAGRLDPDEYSSRVEAATAARSRAELVPLFADLPRPNAVPVTPAVMAEPRPGTLPDDLRATLAADGLLFWAEDLDGTMTYRRYRASGHRIFRRTVKMRGAVAVTRQRLVVWAAAAKRVDLAFADARWDSALTIAVDRSGRLRIVAWVGPFHPDRSGRIEYRFTTPHAREVVDLVHASR